MSLIRMVRQKTESEVKVASLDLQLLLDDGELLIDPVTISEIGTNDLSFSNQAVSIVNLTINGISVPAGKAVQLRIVGGLAGNIYNLQAQVGTNSNPNQLNFVNFKLRVVSDAA